jgi:hypothetical protein
MIFGIIRNALSFYLVPFTPESLPHLADALKKKSTKQLRQGNKTSQNPNFWKALNFCAHKPILIAS